MIDRFILSIFLFVCFLSLVTNLSNQVSVWNVQCARFPLFYSTKAKTEQKKHNYYVMINSTRLSSSLSLCMPLSFLPTLEIDSFLFSRPCAHMRAHTHFSQTVKSAKLICFVIRFESRSILDCIMASFRWRLCRCVDGVLCAAK